MRNRGLSLIVVVLVALASHAETQHMPRGTATDGSRAEVEATIEKAASVAVSDQAIRVVSTNGEYNVGVGAVDRATTAATTTGGSVEPSQITEVCHVIEGRRLPTWWCASIRTEWCQRVTGRSKSIQSNGGGKV